jgi:hypothetical protein
MKEVTKTERVNPYLFLLLRNMVRRDLEKIMHKWPSIKDITYYLVGDSDSELARGLRDKFRKIWSWRGFDEANEIHLDIMAVKVRCRSFDSWRHFVEVEGNNAFFIVGQIMTFESFDRLEPKQRELVKSLADRRLADIYLHVPPELTKYSEIVLNLKEMNEQVAGKRSQLTKDINNTSFYVLKTIFVNDVLQFAKKAGSSLELLQHIQHWANEIKFIELMGIINIKAPLPQEYANAMMKRREQAIKELELLQAIRG